MRLALKEEYARRARFIMGVSHDLRTPLTLIQGYVEAIADGYAAEPEAQKKYLSIILDKTRTLENMVGELIEFVRMETGQWRMTHEEVPGASLPHRPRAPIRGGCPHPEAGFRLVGRRPGQTRPIRMDAGLFDPGAGEPRRQCDPLHGGGGEDRHDSRQPGRRGAPVHYGYAASGIPDEDLSRIYDPFYRGTNSRREQGFGLGLTTVKSIIESHGWSITVASQVGTGTKFTVTMPLSTGGAA